MANTQTAVPLFVANAILTAAQQNISAGTGVPVFATTVTRDAAFGGSNKALAEGQLAYIEASNVVQYYDGAAWATVGPATAGALVLVKTQTIGTTVSSVAVTSAFSSTYDNYKIMISGGVGSVASVEIGLQLGATTTGYYYSLLYGGFAGGAASNAAGSNAAQFLYAANANTTSINGTCELLSPNLAKNTNLFGAYVEMKTTGLGGTFNGFLNNSTQYTDFTLNMSGGTLTGGTIYVYGYAKA